VYVLGQAAGSPDLKGRAMIANGREHVMGFLGAALIWAGPIGWFRLSMSLAASLTLSAVGLALAALALIRLLARTPGPERHRSAPARRAPSIDG
jgi:hypothetical protein